MFFRAFSFFLQGFLLIKKKAAPPESGYSFVQCYGQPGNGWSRPSSAVRGAGLASQLSLLSISDYLAIGITPLGVPLHRPLPR